MTSTKNPLALVGYGYWGQKIAKVLQNLSPLVYICDPILKNSTEEFEVISLESLKQNVSLRNVFIATPELTHFRLANEFLQSNKNVFLEKPLVMNAAEAKQLCQTANQQKQVLFCDYIFLFDPFVSKIQELIHANEIGELIEIQSHRSSVGFHKPDIQVSDDLLIHDLYLGEFFFENEVIAVQNQADHFLLIFAEGKILKSWCSYSEQESRREMILIGTKGKITWKRMERGEAQLELDARGKKTQVKLKINLSALQSSVEYFLTDCANESEESTLLRYKSYIRHTAMLESVRGALLTLKKHYTHT